MSHRIGWAVAVVVLGLGWAATSADARESAAAMLRRAAKLEGVEAAQLLGKATRIVHKAGDLQVEKRAAEAIADLLGKAGRSNEPGAAGSQDLLVVVLSEMDAQHSGAYVSAHALAREALITATRSGGFGAVPVAAKVLKTYAKGRHRGLSAKMMDDYAAGLAVLIEPDRDEKATAGALKRLDAALSVCVEQKWYEMATVIGTELAAAHLAVEQPDLAKDALARAASASAGPTLDPQVIHAWDSAVRLRLDGASDEVLAPFLEVRDLLRGMGAMPGGAGGAGAPGLAAGEDPTTELAAAWRKLKRGSPVVTVKRGGTDLTIHLAYVDKSDESGEYQAGTRFQRIGDVVLVFHGQAVALEDLEFKLPRNGLPGSSPVRSRWKAWTLLAEGETWSVSKKGRVSVRGK